jgi:hypothetical protein
VSGDDVAAAAEGAPSKNVVPCHMYALYLRSSPATTTEDDPIQTKPNPIIAINIPP